MAGFWSWLAKVVCCSSSAITTVGPEDPEIEALYVLFKRIDRAAVDDGIINKVTHLIISHSIITAASCSCYLTLFAGRVQPKSSVTTNDAQYLLIGYVRVMPVFFLQFDLIFERFSQIHL